MHEDNICLSVSERGESFGAGGGEGEEEMKITQLLRPPWRRLTETNQYTVILLVHSITVYCVCAMAADKELASYRSRT